MGASLLPAPSPLLSVPTATIAPALAEYVQDRGFTHVEFLPADGASVLRFVGISDDRLFCADQPLRPPARPDVPDRLPAPARHRRHPRLGALAFHHRRARAGLFRRHASLRTCRSAARIARRMAQLLVQLRPQRSPRVPAELRACFGSTSTTPTACESMRWLRCSISTTPAATANGFPTNLAAGRTSRPSASCAT